MEKVNEFSLCTTTKVLLKDGNERFDCSNPLMDVSQAKLQIIYEEKKKNEIEVSIYYISNLNHIFSIFSY